jgi:DNA-binding CsgD family transcriptional regulator
MSEGYVHRTRPTIRRPADAGKCAGGAPSRMLYSDGGAAMAMTRSEAVQSELLLDLYRLQEPAEVLRALDRHARRLVPYDLAVPAFTDRPTGSVALDGVPPDFADGYARHAGEDLARLAHLAPRHAGAVRLSEVVPSSLLRRSGIYHELLRPNRITAVITTCLVENTRTTGIVKMIRLHAGADFSERERDLLARMAPHVRRAYANAEAMAHLAREARQFRAVCDRFAGGAMVVDTRGGVLYQNSAAESLLRRHFGVPARRGPTAGARLPEALRGVLSPVQPTLVHEGADGRALAVRAARLGDGAGEILLLLEEREGRAAGPALSAREQEVLDWVGQGKTNGEIGLILGISARTVQTHLDHVFAKLGVVSRAQAVAEALRRRPD